MTLNGNGTNYEVAVSNSRMPPPWVLRDLLGAVERLDDRTVHRDDVASQANGSAAHGLDVRLPGMVYAVIKHCPTIGGTLAAPPRVPAGMLAVVPARVASGPGGGIEGIGRYNAIAVVGPNSRDTCEAARRLAVQWSQPVDAPAISSTPLSASAEALLTEGRPYVSGGPNPPGTVYTVEGDTRATEGALALATRTVDVTYSLPYVAPASMAALNCTVDYVPGVKCDVYAPTRSARSVLSVVASLTGLAPNQINVYTTYLGGGLGRTSEVDFVSQAVQVGMAVKRPVQLMWPHEEDFAHDAYQPMAMIRARAGLDALGTVVGWAYRNVSPSILSQRGAVLGATGDRQAIEGATALPYAFGTRLTEYVTHPSPVPVGFWLSVGASLNTFAVESTIDEVAAAAGKDPYEFRRALLTDSRWMAVLDAAASLGGWHTKPPSGHARGIAIGAAFNGIVAEVVDVSMSGVGTARVNSVAVAIDCCLADPPSFEAQLAGGIAHGLNAALYGRQFYTNGAAQYQTFSQHRMMSAGERPAVKVAIIANRAAGRQETIAGAGELGVPTLAPAVANAWCRLTGTRLRTLPFYSKAAAPAGLSIGGNRG